MKTTLFLRVPTLVALSLFFCLAMSAQNGHPKPTSLSGKTTAGCTNDVTAPEIHCPYVNCLPTARAAYLISQNGEPWGYNDNRDAMDAVFGSSNWDTYYLGDVTTAALLSPAYRVIFLEGSNYGGYVLDNFLNNNRLALENWVAAGGALFINCFSDNAPSIINAGFGGVVIQNYYGSYYGMVQIPEHPIFNTPFTPANGDFSGSYFSNANIIDPDGLALITDGGSGTSLSEKTWGRGKVFFGGLVIPSYQSPQPNVQNLRQNILANLNTVCSIGAVLPVDAGSCLATVAALDLNATATDDCAVTSLTHDFLAAPANTSLTGAIFPTTPTLVRWTATDAAGHSSTCEFFVSAHELEVPTVVCPADMVLTADAGTCGAVANFTATGTDNCSTVPTISATPASGSVFNSGSTTVTVVAVDESGNRSTSCSFIVTVGGNPELCNGFDDDCNGQIDDGAPADNTFYADTDGDGYGDVNHSVLACLVPYGYVANSSDCDDTNYYIQPGMSEYCNGIDDNCDGTIDEGVQYTWYADADGDEYGDPNITKLACEQPAGYSYIAGDCDDTNRYIHPGVQEDCTNTTDENCDGILGDNTFTIAETHTDVYCGSTPDGTISITMSPAQNYTAILWSNGAYGTTTQTNLQPGTYKVTVTNECGTTKTQSIEIRPSPTPALKVTMTGKGVTCYGDGDGNITATPEDGCAGYTYLWSNNSTDASLSGLSGGIYSVVVTDGCGCTQTGTFTVNEASGPLYIYSGAVIPLLDGTYWVQVLPGQGTSPYKFRRTTLPSGYTPWTTSNGFADIAPGNYTFEVQDQNGCTAQLNMELTPFTPPPAPHNKSNVETVHGTDATINKEETASTEVDDRQLPSTAQNLSVSVFPNPTDGELNIEWSGFEGQSAILQIVNNMGQLLRTLPVPDNALRVMTNVTALPGGIYFLKILTADKQVKTVRFVKS